MKLGWHVGDIVRKARMDAGIMQAELAGKVGVRAATLSRIENTGDYDPKILRDIAEALESTDIELLSLIPGRAGALSDDERGQLLCSDPDHRRYQVMVDEIIHADQLRSEWLRGGIVTFHQVLFGDSGSSGDVKHDRFSASDPIGSGPGKTRLYRAKVDKVRVKP